MWVLVLWPGVEAGPPALGAQSLSPLDCQGSPFLNVLKKHFIHISSEIVYSLGSKEKYLSETCCSPPLFFLFHLIQVINVIRFLQILFCSFKKPFSTFILLWKFQSYRKYRLCYINHMCNRDPVFLNLNILPLWLHMYNFFKRTRPLEKQVMFPLSSFLGLRLPLFLPEVTAIWTWWFLFFCVSAVYWLWCSVTSDSLWSHEL